MTAPEDEYEAGDVNTVDESAGTGGPEDEYEAGDVNTVGAPGGGHDAEGADAEGTDAEGNRAEGGSALEVLTYIARSLASEPDAVVVQTDQRPGGVRLRLHVAPEDMGRVIGRRGRTAQAIRTLVGVAGVRDGLQASVDIVDD